MLWFRTCPVAYCQGSLAALVKPDGDIVLFCDEADHVWRRPEDVDLAEPTYLRPDDPGPTRWATRAEADALGWDVEWQEAFRPEHRPDQQRRLDGLGSSTKSQVTLPSIEDQMARRALVLSAEHMVALEAWVRSEPVGGAGPPGDWILQRFLGQLCGRAVRDRSADDLRLATRAALRAGAWVGDTRGDRRWRLFSFVWFGATAIGLDPSSFLWRTVVDIDPELDEMLDRAMAAIRERREPEDEEGAAHVAVWRGAEVVYEPRWDAAGHERWRDVYARRYHRVRAEFDRLALDRGAEEANGFLARRVGLELPWLASDQPVFSVSPSPAEIEKTVDAWFHQGGTRPLPITESDAVEFVGFRSAEAVRRRDERRLAPALAVAALAVPVGLGLVFRAAQALPVGDPERFLVSMIEKSAPLGRPEVVGWADRPDRFTNLAGRVEIGLIGGFDYALAFAGRRGEDTDGSRVDRAMGEGCGRTR